MVRYSGWFVYGNGEEDQPAFCSDGYEWSDGSSEQWKKVKCKAVANGTRQYLYDMTNKVEVSCKGSRSFFANGLVILNIFKFKQQVSQIKIFSI